MYHIDLGRVFVSPVQVFERVKPEDYSEFLEKSAEVLRAFGPRGDED